MKLLLSSIALVLLADSSKAADVRAVSGHSGVSMKTVSRSGVSSDSSNFALIPSRNFGSIVSSQALYIASNSG